MCFNGSASISKSWSTRPSRKSWVKGVPVVLSADVFKYWHVDDLAKTCRIIFQDGRVVEGKLEPEWVPAKHLFASSTFGGEKWWIFSTTTRGHIIITEGFNHPIIEQHVGERSPGWCS